MRSKIFYSVILVLIITSVFGQQYSLECLNDITQFNQKYGYAVSIKFVKSGNITSLPNHVIEIDNEYLGELLEDKDEETKKYLLRLILTHECAHQIQYYRMNGSKYFNDDPYSKMLIETHADILAGISFITLSQEIVALATTDSHRVQEILDNIALSFYNLGIEENTEDTHPSKQDRLMAINLGMRMGLLLVFDEGIKYSIAHKLAINKPLDMLQKTINHEKLFFNLKDNEDIIEWSLRQACKIMNYDRKTSNNLVLNDSKTTIKFDTNNKNPYCYYHLEYKNIGTEEIETDMTVYIKHVPLNNKESVIKHMMFETKHYSFSLERNKTYTITDSILWDKIDDDHLLQPHMGNGNNPRLVFPGSKEYDGLYSCKYKEENKKIPTQSLHYELEEKKGTLSDFENFINRLIRAGKSPENLISGIGIIEEFDNERIKYSSIIQYGANTKTYIIKDTEIDEPVTSIVIEFPFFKSLDEMNVMLKQTLESSKKCLKNISGSYEQDTNKGGKMFLITSEKCNITLETSQYVSDNKTYYILRLDITI